MERKKHEIKIHFSFYQQKKTIFLMTDLRSIYFLDRLLNNKFFVIRGHYYNRIVFVHLTNLYRKYIFFFYFYFYFDNLLFIYILVREFYIFHHQPLFFIGFMSKMQFLSVYDKTFFFIFYIEFQL